MEGEELVMFFCPALPLEEVVDPTGAGDTFAGGFIGHVARTGSARISTPSKQGIVVGSALASFTCEAFGTRASVRCAEEMLDNRVDAFRRMMSLRVHAAADRRLINPEAEIRNCGSMAVPDSHHSKWR